MNHKITSIFKKFFKGNVGEEEVLNSIVEILRKNGDENYYLIPKATIKDTTSSREIDLLLLHPIFGIYVIEVKNWEKLNITEENNPFTQAKEYKNLILSLLNENFNKMPINVEYRVVFPSISKSQAEEFFENNSYFKNYENHSFFKEDLENSDIFKRFFNSTATIMPNKKEFIKIAKFFVPDDTLKNKKIIPIITKDEILFFDQKQLSVLNGYTGGFRIIRGVAGTGKTVILTNFISNKLKNYPDETFLILCFNRKLANDIKYSFDKNQRNNIKVFSVFEFLKEIGFELPKRNFNEYYEYFETTQALKEFREKLRTYLQKNPIDYFLSDETQDLPAGFVRIIYEEINDTILFIDEAQRFYDFTMKNIADVFKHPEFEKLSMRGRVKNLKNVYRTPSNISKCAFEILSFDKSINDYYKKSYYLKNNFLNDINFVLEDGNIYIDDLDDFDKLLKLVKTLPQDKENIILTYTKNSKEAIEEMVKEHNIKIKVLTMQSVKGLEAHNVVIHKFGDFLINNIKYKDVFYRQIYVLLTRAQENIYLSINESKLINHEAEEILKILKDYQTKDKNIKNESNIKIAKIKPKIEKVKSGMEFIVTAGELFGVIAGLFNS